MAITVLLPFQIKRQQAAPLDVDSVFQTEAALNSYLTNPRRYPLMVVGCVETQEIYKLNAAGDAWIALVAGEDTGDQDLQSVLETGNHASEQSMVLGDEDSSADGINSIAQGTNAVASGAASRAAGTGVRTFEDNSSAEGQGAVTLQQLSSVRGLNSATVGTDSHVIGDRNIVGDQSFSKGNDNWVGVDRIKVTDITDDDPKVLVLQDDFIGIYARLLMYDSTTGYLYVLEGSDAPDSKHIEFTQVWGPALPTDFSGCWIVFGDDLSTGADGAGAGNIVQGNQARVGGFTNIIQGDNAVGNGDSNRGMRPSIDIGGLQNFGVAQNTLIRGYLNKVHTRDSDVSGTSNIMGTRLDRVTYTAATRTITCQYIADRMGDANAGILFDPTDMANPYLFNVVNFVDDNTVEVAFIFKTEPAGDVALEDAWWILGSLGYSGHVSGNNNTVQVDVGPAMVSGKGNFSYPTGASTVEGESNTHYGGRNHVQGYQNILLAHESTVEGTGNTLNAGKRMHVSGNNNFVGLPAFMDGAITLDDVDGWPVNLLTIPQIGTLELSAGDRIFIENTVGRVFVMLDVDTDSSSGHFADVFGNYVFPDPVSNNVYKLQPLEDGAPINDVYVEGLNNTVYGGASHTEGSGHTVYPNATTGHTEGNQHSSDAPTTHVEGERNISVDGSSMHAEGDGHVITGHSAHVEGSNNLVGWKKIVTGEIDYFSDVPEAPGDVPEINIAAGSLTVDTKILVRNESTAYFLLATVVAQTYYTRYTLKMLYLEQGWAWPSDFTDWAIYIQETDGARAEGSHNIAERAFSSAMGVGSRTIRPTERAHAAGKFAREGDSQTSYYDFGTGFNNSAISDSELSVSMGIQGFEEGVALEPNAVYCIDMLMSVRGTSSGDEGVGSSLVIRARQGLAVEADGTTVQAPAGSAEILLQTGYFSTADSPTLVLYQADTEFLLGMSVNNVDGSANTYVCHCTVIISKVVQY